MLNGRALSVPFTFQDRMISPHMYTAIHQICWGNVVSNLNNRSPDLDQSIVVNQELNDRSPTRFQPFEKGAVRSVSDSKPDDNWSNGCPCGPFGVLVFYDDDGIDAKCMIPDHGIFGAGQTDVIDVLG